MDKTANEKVAFVHAPTKSGVIRKVGFFNPATGKLETEVPVRLVDEAGTKK